MCTASSAAPTSTNPADASPSIANCFASRSKAYRYEPYPHASEEASTGFQAVARNIPLNLETARSYLAAIHFATAPTGSQPVLATHLGGSRNNPKALQGRAALELAIMRAAFGGFGGRSFPAADYPIDANASTINWEFSGTGFNSPRSMRSESARMSSLTGATPPSWRRFETM